MLESIKQLLGHKLSASDGEIGHVKDFYFDDQSWAVRYVVADTGSWLPGRQVLISPHAFRGVHEAGKLASLHLTRKQIEDSPPIESHQPVSRQYEEEFYGYYGWPAYWMDGGVWGLAAAPAWTPPSSRENKPRHGHNQRDDIHLRSAKAVTGYRIEASDGTIGAVSDFKVDDVSWTIRDFAVEAGHWYLGKEILIPTGMIERISDGEAKVFVNLTREDIQRTAEGDVAHTGAATFSD